MRLRGHHPLSREARGQGLQLHARAEILPFDFVDFADTVQKYTKDLEKLLADKQEEIRERNQELDEGVFRATLDSNGFVVAPTAPRCKPRSSSAVAAESCHHLVAVCSITQERYVISSPHAVVYSDSA